MRTTTQEKFLILLIPRPDDFIRQDVQWKLTQNGFIDGRNIQVTVKEGIVTLIGSVPLKSDKKKIALLLQNIDGIVHVENRLKIDRVSRFTDDHSMHGF